MPVTLGDGLGAGREARLEKALVRLNKLEQNVLLVLIMPVLATASEVIRWYGCLSSCR